MQDSTIKSMKDISLNLKIIDLNNLIIKMNFIGIIPKILKLEGDLYFRAQSLALAIRIQNILFHEADCLKIEI